MANKDKLNDNRAQDVESLETQGSVEKNDDKVSTKIVILSFLTAIFIMLAVPFGAFYVAISYNTRGITDTYRDEIKKIPILNLALGKTKEPEDLTKLTEKELIAYIKKLQIQKEKLAKDLKDNKEKADKLTKASNDTETIRTENTKLKDEIAKTKAEYSKKTTELQKEKKDIDNLIANGDKAGFTKYFEKIDSKNADEIYESLKKKEVQDEETKKFAKIYQEMEADAAAKIFESMGEKKNKHYYRYTKIYG